MPSVVLSAWHGEGAVGFAGLPPGNGAGRSKCNALVFLEGAFEDSGRESHLKLNWHTPLTGPGTI